MRTISFSHNSTRNPINYKERKDMSKNNQKENDININHHSTLNIIDNQQSNKFYR